MALLGTVPSGQGQRAKGTLFLEIQKDIMRIKTTLLLAALSLPAFAGCGHMTMRGTVAMKGDNQEAHVCMGDKEVKAGDRVALFKNVCAARGGKVGAADVLQTPLSEVAPVGTLLPGDP